MTFDVRRDISLTRPALGERPPFPPRDTPTVCSSPWPTVNAALEEYRRRVGRGNQYTHRPIVPHEELLRLFEQLGLSRI